MSDNSLQGANDNLRDVDRLLAGVKTPVMQLDLGGGNANAEVLIVAGQQTMALSVPVVLASNQTTIPFVYPDVVVSGTITATDAVVGAPAGAGAFVSGASTANSYVALACPGGDSAWALELTGTFGGGTVYYEESLTSTNGVDGNWIAVNGRQTGVVNTVLGIGATVAGMYRGNTSGVKWYRVRMVGAASPNVAVTIRLSSGSGAIFLNASIPGGTNVLGGVTQSGTWTVTGAGGTFPVTGTFFQATQPVSNAGTFAVQGTLAAETTKVIGTVNQAALTKGTQGTTGVSTQDLKDGGRSTIAITCYRAAGIITTEALFAAATFANSVNGAAPSTGTQFTVTAGKKLRIQSVECSIFNNAAVACTSKLVLRWQAAGGTIANTSPILAIWDIGSNSTVTGNYIGPIELSVPDNIEIPAGATYGFTVLSSAATVLHTITVNAFEF